MHRIKRLLLIFLMLCGLSGVFVTTFIMAGTASAVSRSGPNPTCDSMGDCCSGEFCCWAQGQTPPLCDSASTSQSPGSTSQPGEQTGRIDGERAAKDNKIRQCPGVEGSPYCNGWYQGYDKIAKGRGQGQGSGISLFGIPIPTPVLIIGIGILIAIGISTLGIGAIAGAGPAAPIFARFRR